jgi:hypothetical protein
MNPSIPGAVATSSYPNPSSSAPSSDHEPTATGEDDAPPAARPGAIYSLALSVHLANVGISVIVEKPVRREFLSLSLFDLSGKVRPYLPPYFKNPYLAPCLAPI